MKTTSQTAAATTTVLAALVLAGCQAGGSTSGTAAGAASGGTSAAAAPTSATHSGPASAASATAPASGSAGVAAAGPPRCHTASLAVTLGAPQGPAGGQQTMTLTFTNTSAAACSMYGFPGVNLVAGGIQWALERQSQPPRQIVLPPGGHSGSTLTLLRWETGDGTSFAPTKAYVTPPDETTYATLAWPSGVVLIRQDEATHPGTFIGPVG
jgi:Protein of unknown function (DUF4232)